jgi:hypothetical protein
MPYDPVIPLLCIYPKELIAELPRELYIHVHNSITHKNWKQPKYPPIDE